MESVKKVSNKNRWCYGTGCIGRDMVYTMVSLFMLTYVQFAVGITGEQLAVLTAIIILCRVWDAVNDPMMGTIITNTKTKFGKYRPWILIGAILNAIFFVLMFSVQLEGWAFVFFFGAMYLLWGMTFTMNDVSYWSLLPALAVEKKQRDQLTTMVTVFAAVGAFTAGGLIPILTTGNAVEAYRMIAIAIAIVFLICQVMVFFCVRDNTANEPPKEKITIKKMFQVIRGNPQLLWMAIVVLVYSLGSALLNAFGQNFFYFEFEYEGTRMFIFTVIYAIGTIISQGIYPILAKKFKRAQLTKASTILLVVGYLLFFVLGGLTMDYTLKLIILCIFGVLIFAGQGVFYMNMLIMLTNTIEYDEWRTGVRNESIVFSIRPFMVKLSSAFQQLIFTLTLSLTGLLNISNRISEVEKTEGLTQEQIQAIANEILVDASNNEIFFWQKFGLRFSMTILPIILFIIAYIIIKKKYIIDEDMYEKILIEIDERKKEEILINE